MRVVSPTAGADPAQDAANRGESGGGVTLGEADGRASIVSLPQSGKVVIECGQRGPGLAELPEPGQGSTVSSSSAGPRARASPPSDPESARQRSTGPAPRAVGRGPTGSMPVASRSTRLMPGPVSVSRARAVRRSQCSPSSNSHGRIENSGEVRKRRRDNRLRAPAVLLGEGYRFPAPLPGWWRRASRSLMRKPAPPGRPLRGTEAVRSSAPGRRPPAGAARCPGCPAPTPQRSRDSSAPRRAGRCPARCPHQSRR